MASLRDSYSVGTINTYTNFLGTAWRAIVFKTGVAAYKITSAKFYMHKEGGTTYGGIVTVSLRATDANGKPTGTDLCSGTVAVSSLGTANPATGWTEISLGVGCTVSANTRYAWLLRDNSANGYGNFEYVSSQDPYQGDAQGIRINSADSGATWTTPTFSGVQVAVWYQIWGDSLTNISKIAGVAYASIAKVAGVLIASVKKIAGLA